MRTSQSHSLSIRLCKPMDYSPAGSSVHGISQARIMGVGCHFLLQKIFPSQESNLHLLVGRWILYHMGSSIAPIIYTYFRKLLCLKISGRTSNLCCYLYLCFLIVVFNVFFWECYFKSIPLKKNFHLSFWI